jgi:hypothetical protein
LKNKIDLLLSWQEVNKKSTMMILWHQLFFINFFKVILELNFVLLYYLRYND